MDETNFYNEMIEAWIRIVHALEVIRDVKEIERLELEATNLAKLALAQDTNRIANELTQLNHLMSRVLLVLELLVGVQKAKR